jgi:plasmid stability protein
MAALSIRNLEEGVRERLRIRAARHGRSMEAEIRSILTNAVSEPAPERELFTDLLSRFTELGGVDLTLPERTARARAAELPG